MLFSTFFINKSKRNLLKSVVSGLFMLSMFQTASTFALTSTEDKNTEIYQNSAQMEVKLGLLSNKKVDVILKIPTQQAYSFAGEAETPEQKATVDSVVDNLKQNIKSIISVDPSLECKYNVNDVDKFSTAKENYEKSTATTKKKIKAEYKVLEVDVTLDCLKDLPSQTFTVNLSQSFKNINKIFVDLKGKQKRKIVIDNSSGSFSL